MTFYSTISSTNPQYSWKAIKYMVCKVQYGGRITDDLDRELFNAYGEDYLKEAINDFNKFRVSGMGTIQGLVKAMPVLMEQIKEISKEINIEDFNILKEISSKYK